MSESPSLMYQTRCLKVDQCYVENADDMHRLLTNGFDCIHARLDHYDGLTAQIRRIATLSAPKGIRKSITDFDDDFEWLDSLFPPDCLADFLNVPTRCLRGYPRSYQIGTIAAHSAHELVCRMFYHVADLWIESRQVAIHAAEERQLVRSCEHFYRAWLSFSDTGSQNLRLWLRAEYDRACIYLRPHQALDLTAGAELVRARHAARTKSRVRLSRGHLTIATRSLNIDVTQRATARKMRPIGSAKVIESGAHRFERHGNMWHLRFSAEAVTVPHKVGMIYIQRLLQHPSLSVSVQELVAPDAVGAALATTTDDRSLDMKAVGTLLCAARELRASIDAACRVNNTVEKDVLQRELSAIEHQLKQRNQATRPELKKMQSSVGKAIRRAIDSIARHHKPLHVHLRDHIQTGYMPCYTPPTPISWLT